MNSPRLAQELWTQLWLIYRQRVAYARVYENMIQAAGGTVANDHIAFRSLRLEVDSTDGKINLGIPYLESIVQWLGYEAAGEYHFRDRHLYARHYRHPEQDQYDLPKLFISELIVEQLPSSIAQSILDTVQSGSFSSLPAWQKSSLPSQQDEKAIAKALISIFTRPWTPPKRTTVEEVNEVSQYGAWVLLHGYSVNHFTGYVNRQNTPIYPDLESTAHALANQGVPMKDSFEGGKASGLKQTATQSVIESVPVLNKHGHLDEMLWSYAYYELAERYLVPDSTGNQTLFEGFIAPQAQHLFDMTKAK
ncbi:DUF1338 domain-containing protein [Pleurocapsa sp. PCC 7319]|uniref:DUF1338 domain-containing protein n=1 Tax=Pleurocapsa sp. PCC 7319 TaxID=118161 RepID=UPI00034DAC5E|nr:DUF1338 domain-containing protein [Pleurocapsa sp. PCC 7319]